LADTACGRLGRIRGSASLNAGLRARAKGVTFAGAAQAVVSLGCDARPTSGAGVHIASALHGLEEFTIRLGVFHLVEQELDADSSSMGCAVSRRIHILASSP